MIELGYCQCGCGEKTTISTYNDPRFGYIKGIPRKYKSGHFSKGKTNPKWKGGKRIRPDGYSYIWKPNHHRACRNYVMEHILIAEKALGKPLPLNAEVHHFNKNRKDNTNSNLIICQDQAYHLMLHRRERAYRACGHAHWRKCEFCKEWDDPINMFINSQNRAYHVKCERQNQKKRKSKEIKPND